MEKTSEKEIFGIMLQILLDGPSWNKGKLEESAVLLLPGTFQEYRISEGVKLWPNEAKYLWVAGTRGDPEYSRQDIIKALGGNDSPDVVCQGFAKHTKDQIEWCVSLLKENPNVRSLIITTAAYHLPRCVLTFLKCLIKQNMQIPICPRPLLNPSGDSFALEGKENYQGEITRIADYQINQDVALCEEWRKYINWRIKAL